MACRDGPFIGCAENVEDESRAFPHGYAYADLDEGRLGLLQSTVTFAYFLSLFRTEVSVGPLILCPLQVR